MAEEIRNTEESGTKRKDHRKGSCKNSNIFITICKYIIKGTGYLCLFLVPILSYYLFEYVTGIWQIFPFMTALNICWVYVLYLILTGITGTTRISVPVGLAVLLIISFAETFVVGFPGPAYYIWDVLAVPGSCKRIKKQAAFGCFLCGNCFCFWLWLFPQYCSCTSDGD